MLAKKGGHERCNVVQNANAACDGPPRTITFTDYQQVLASDGSSTYEPGLVALIGNKINKTLDLHHVHIQRLLDLLPRRAFRWPRRID